MTRRSFLAALALGLLLLSGCRDDDGETINPRSPDRVPGVPDSPRR